MPNIGEPWFSRNTRLAGLRVSRVEGFKAHLIFYLSSDVGIEIIRVLHASRDLGSILDAAE
jgi:toxin ParE1/3/4